MIRGRFPRPFGDALRDRELREIDDSVEGRVPGLEGRLKMRDIRQWDVVRVAPEVVRACEAGPDGLELIAVGGPKPEGGDGVLSDASWPDAD